MGYTLSVKFKTEQEKDKMENFLLSQSDILNQMDILEHGSQTNSHTLGDMTGGYAPKQKNLLGFHVRVSPEYIWNLCAWMAVKAECKDKKDNIFFYHDSKKMLVTFDPNNTQNTLVNPTGIPIYESTDLEEAKQKNRPQDMLDYLQQVRDNKLQIIDLFAELNDKWNEFNLQYHNSITKKMKP